ncbi:MAG: DNA mismatch repair protein MutL [Dehalococcoidia bacterium]|nr:DNA mismatch repair protein MutL [Dehalococcoidia bacterium]MQG15300.1 DNA mismatch repair endonuclease MutL [SAR202 cluster bacterium]
MSLSVGRYICILFIHVFYKINIFTDTWNFQYNRLNMIINILDKGVSSLIAAGEVVERPVSIVKELIENSLDAGSKRVDVIVQHGGIQTIQVVDDGQGISSAQMALAFHRFATSKLQTIEGLDQIRTLGFRGEALASISAVSDTTMISRPVTQDIGTKIHLIEGDIVNITDQGSPLGTSITVSNLFANFPARRKFLRSPGAESSKIVNLCSKYALAYPDVAWNLTLGGKNKFITPGNGQLIDAFTGIYGVELSENMIPIKNFTGNDINVQGLISSTKINRSNRANIHIFVNGRWISSPLLNQAVTQGYHNLLPERKFPVCVIDIKLNPAEVDVNVHPAKTEVRFLDSSAVFSAVHQSIRQTLIEESGIPTPTTYEVSKKFSENVARSGSFWTSNLKSSENRTTNILESMIQHHTIDTDSQFSHVKVLPLLRVLGQVKNTYIVNEGPDGIYVIDQHAAHERVLYEDFLSGVNTSASQALLDSVVVDLESHLIDSMDSITDLLSDIGFVFEHFGDSSYILRGVPTIFNSSDPKDGFIDVITNLLRENVDDRRDAAVKTIACHAAVRAGKTLSLVEMQELIKSLEICKEPQTCAHGRPTVIHLNSNYLESQFGRR